MNVHVIAMVMVLFGVGCTSCGATAPSRSARQSALPTKAAPPPLTSEQLRAGIAKGASAIAACSSSSKTGYVRVRFRITAAGRVSTAHVVFSPVPQKAINACVRQHVLSLRFPPSGGGWVSYPFFVGAQLDRGKAVKAGVSQR